MNGIGKLPNAFASGSSTRSGIDLSGVPSEFRPLLEEQQKMNKEQELVTYLSNLMKSRHETTMAILNNMK